MICEIDSQIMWSQLPGLQWLRGFEAAARLGSVSAAANELFLTHGAVSRQIRSLEAELGVLLFERRNRKIVLTESGRMLAQAVAASFEQLSRASEDVKRAGYAKTYSFSCERTLLMRWLIPRLDAIASDELIERLRIIAAGGPVFFGRDGIDVAIRRLDFELNAGTHAESIGDEYVGPVCAPSYAESREVRNGLMGARLLHTNTRLDAWDHWFRRTAMKRRHRGDSTHQHFFLAIQAAVSGLGVAIGPYTCVVDDLRSGRLVAPWGFIPDGSSYHLLTPDPIGPTGDMHELLNGLRSTWVTPTPGELNQR
jgi:LysR family transcriptional regulator, glycine cleavage system transcriptional activator